MRDGKALHAWIDRPAAAGCAAPAVLVQTPYDIETAKGLFLGVTRQDYPLFASPDYAFVLVDWRGFHGSKAAAVTGATQPYGDDGYDLVEWTARQAWSTGKVGTWGVSALCVQQYRTAAKKPPHLAAGVPIFCSMNLSYGQYYPGGVLRREYVAMLGALGFGGTSIYGQHPYPDALWNLAAVALSPADVEVPMLVVAGWWDLHNPGSFATFDDLRLRGGASARAAHRLLVGEGIRRLKLRGSYAAPLAVVPNQKYPLSIALANDMAYTVATGHRLGLVVSGSNDARFDRNPDNGDDFFSTAATAVTATNTLYAGASKVSLPAYR